MIEIFVECCWHRFGSCRKHIVDLKQSVPGTRHRADASSRARAIVRAQRIPYEGVDSRRPRRHETHPVERCSADWALNSDCELVEWLVAAVVAVAAVLLTVLSFLRMKE